MSETVTKFNVVFRGDIVLGHNLADVKARLQKLFKADAAKIDALFTGRPIPLKKNLDDASAKKYHHVLRQAGADVSLVPVVDVKAVVNQVAEKKPVSAQSDTTQKTTATHLAPEAAELSLAPVGSDVLAAGERTVYVDANIDVSDLSLRETQGNILDDAEIVADTASLVQVPDYDVADVGADMVRADEKNALPLPELDIATWDLSEVGEDLIKEAERSVVENVEVQDLNVDLAPVGSDLGQLKKQVEPLNPDISHLKLVDE